MWEQASLDMLELYSEFAVAMPVLAKSVTSGQVCSSQLKI